MWAQAEHKCDLNFWHQAWSNAELLLLVDELEILELDEFVLLHADGLIGLEGICEHQASSSCQTAAPSPAGSLSGSCGKRSQAANDAKHFYMSNALTIPSCDTTEHAHVIVNVIVNQRTWTKNVKTRFCNCKHMCEHKCDQNCWHQAWSNAELVLLVDELEILQLHEFVLLMLMESSVWKSFVDTKFPVSAKLLLRLLQVHYVVLVGNVPKPQTMRSTSKSGKR